MHLRVLLHEWPHGMLHIRNAPVAGKIPRTKALREREADATAGAAAAGMGRDLSWAARAYRSPRAASRSTSTVSPRAQLAEMRRNRTPT